MATCRTRGRRPGKSWSMFMPQHQCRRLEIPRRLLPTACGSAKAALHPGRDFSGWSVRVGQRASTDLKVGDAVFGVLKAGREGTYCEKLAITAAIVAKKPDALSHVNAAALALTGLTAMDSVDGTLKLKRGETILIQGGAGGVAGLCHPVRQTYRRACDHDDKRGEPRLCQKTRRRRGHRLQCAGFHQSRVRRRRGIRYGRRRRGAKKLLRCSSRAAAPPSSRPAWRRRNRPVAT